MWNNLAPLLHQRTCMQAPIPYDICERVADSTLRFCLLAKPQIRFRHWVPHGCDACGTLSAWLNSIPRIVSPVFAV